MIKLNRHHIFLIGVITAFLFVGIHILNYRLNSTFANGKIVAFKKELSNYAVISFDYKGEEIRFLTESTGSLKMNENITVIYKKDNPKNAAVYTFLGFYIFYFYFTIIPLMLFAAFTYSWFDKYDRVSVNWRNRKVSTERLPVKRD